MQAPARAPLNITLGSMAQRDAKEKSWTLFDRVAVAFLFALLGLLTGSFIWLAIVRWSHSAVPFSIVWVFTALMAVLGFLGFDKLLVAVFGGAWEMILRVLGRQD